MKGFFVQLRQRYEYVTLLRWTFARQLISLMLSMGKTKIDVAEHALNTARGVYDNLLGVVLNKVDLKALNRYVCRARRLILSRLNHQTTRH